MLGTVRARKQTRPGPPPECNQPPWALGRPAQPYFRAYGATRGGVPCATNRAIFAPSPPGRPEPPWREGPLVSTPNIWPLRPAHGTTVAPHHGTRTSAHGHPRAVSSLGGAGSRQPRPRIRPPPGKNSETLMAPRTPELTDYRGGGGGDRTGRSVRVARSIIAAGGWTIPRWDCRTRRSQKDLKKNLPSDILTLFSHLGG
jgi:hypothetical protein